MDDSAGLGVVRFLRALTTFAVDLLGQALVRGRRLGALQLDGRDGVALRPEELAHVIDRFWPSPGGGEVPDADASWSRFQVEVETLMAADEPTARGWWDLVTRLRLAEVEQQLLALLVACGVNRTLIRAFRYAWADFNRWTMPLGFACRLLLPADAGGGDELEAELAGHALALSALWPDRSPLFRLGLVELSGERPDVALVERGVFAPDDTLRLLTGRPLDSPERLPPRALPDPPAHVDGSVAAVMRRIGHRLRQGQPLRVAIHGPVGSGRLALAGQLACAVAPRGGLWRLDIGRAVANGRGQQAIAEALRLCALADMATVVEGVERLGEERRLWIDRIERAYADAPVPLIWLGVGELEPAITVPAEAVIGLGYPSRAERALVWGQALGGSLEGRDIEQLAGRFLLTGGQIEALASEALACADGSAESLRLDLASRARRAAGVGLGQLATPESARVDLDQVVVSDEVATLLEEIICYTRNRERLATEWGFERSMSYGLGVTILFSGSPGTGKTLSAVAIATALGLELYRVNLAQLVSKYIGETEKHLASVFDAAESGEVMLLFDEADSLFGKRTEVKSSVDRYANLEVNYLLQRVERFNGVVVLTTNFDAGIDDAFARRIRFKVRFEDPDAEARRRLWRLLLPSAVPVCPEVDFDYLAEAYALSGGHIKEVVLRAAALAMDAGRPVDMAVLVRAADAEYRKLGKLAISH